MVIINFLPFFTFILLHCLSYGFPIFITTFSLSWVAAFKRILQT